MGGSDAGFGIAFGSTTEVGNRPKVKATARTIKTRKRRRAMALALHEWTFKTQIAHETLRRATNAAASLFKSGGRRSRIANDSFTSRS